MIAPADECLSGSITSVNDRDQVWLLWHGDDIYDETPDAKLLGVYSSEELARERIARSKQLPGYRDHPESFEISRYEINRDQWPDGYVVVET
jgi:hypothetical protein